MQYRIRYVSDGGPVSRDNLKGWPHSSKNYRTLFSVMKALRNVLNTDARIGVSLGVSVQYRLFAGTEWRWMTGKEIDQTAKEMRIQNWKNLT